MLADCRSCHCQEGALNREEKRTYASLGEALDEVLRGLVAHAKGEHARRLGVLAHKVHALLRVAHLAVREDE
jgi:hypothetical protein